MNSSLIYADSVDKQAFSIPAAPAPALTPQFSISGLNFITAASSFPHAWSWHWYYVVYLLLAWQIADVLWKFWWKAPSNITIAAYPTPLGRWLYALHMIFDAERLLQKAYDSSNGKPFAIPMTDRWIVFVSDPKHLKQLECEPESILSMEEALHELAFTGPILGHLQVPPERKGPRSEAFRVMVGVLKNKLRSNVPKMSNAFQIRIKEAVALEVAPQDKLGTGEKHQDEWHKVRLMLALLRIFTRVNLLVFIGEEQADRIEVYQDVMNFFWSCAKAFPVVNLVPGFLLPFIAPLAMGWGVTRQKVYSLILWLTSQSLQRQDSNDEEPQAFGHITQWTAEMTKLQDTIAVAKVTIGLLFASAFQVPMVAQFVIYRFCKHPEYHERLEAEALEYKHASFGSLNQEMPYLDSFMKETARMTPGIILSAPRQVMQPYTSPEGYQVPTGNWIAIPQVSLMRDESIWPQASTFEGFRFIDEKDGTSKTRFTHPSYDFPFWGSIRHACPARFYVAVVMKMILSHLITEYEFKLADPNARPFLTFGKTRLPSPFLSILVRKRAVSDDEVAN